MMNGPQVTEPNQDKHQNRLVVKLHRNPDAHRHAGMFLREHKDRSEQEGSCRSEQVDIYWLLEI